ncbi:hypothetical protein L873DRAFT_1315025 [Choiromyces venosus 120613-1]|uniref:Uncharacterized protein n=1 Tax=Choiromyces venosus 120613-1 TaxID=1336337 RepID=A0A3N4JGH7_9PEZI|nr:hypothetical protein L873DRAFT_1315025 [Choiromyces venosus 120613-1]
MHYGSRYSWYRFASARHKYTILHLQLRPALDIESHRRGKKGRVGGYFLLRLSSPCIRGSLGPVVCVLTRMVPKKSPFLFFFTFFLLSSQLAWNMRSLLAKIMASRFSPSLPPPQKKRLLDKRFI